MRNLEASAFSWLLRERQCLFALFERNPLSTHRPDVLGVTRSRNLIEIEIKRTWADFQADGLKTHIRNRTRGYDYLPPWKFFYLAEQPLAEQIRPRLPEWAGLLAPTCNSVTVLVEARQLPAQRLSVLQCVRLTHLLGNQIASLVTNHSQKP